MKTHRPRIGKKYMGVLTGAVRRLMSVESDSIKLTDREMADAVNTAREKKLLELPRDVASYDVVNARGILSAHGLIPNKRRWGRSRDKEGHKHKNGAETLVEFSKTHDVGREEMTAAMRSAFPDASPRSLDTTLYNARRKFGLPRLRSNPHTKERE